MERKRDAMDLKILLKNYYSLAKIDIKEDTYDLYFNMIQEMKGDMERIGIRILGEKIAFILKKSGNVKSKLVKILEEELKKDDDNLMYRMIGSSDDFSAEYSKNVERIEDLLNGIKTEAVR